MERTRRQFLIDAAILGAGIIACGTEVPVEQRLREKVAKFKWTDVARGTLDDFTRELAVGYTKLTQTPRLKEKELLAQTFYFQDRTSYLKALAEKGFTQGPREYGAAHYTENRTYMDLSTLKNEALRLGHEAGLALLAPIWHEWGHLDVTERTTGALINNPEYEIKSPTTGQGMSFRKYRGAEVYITEKEGLFHRFEEVLNETINIRRIIEQVGIPNPFFFGLYYQNGLDFFVDFTKKSGISLKTLYDMHATSDFEGLAELVGKNLPGGKDPIDKGLQLFLAIDRNNREMILQTGVFTKL